MHHPSTQEMRQENLEFKDSLGYKVSERREGGRKEGK
jgi:hypothetical protein